MRHKHNLLAGIAALAFGGAAVFPALAADPPTPPPPVTAAAYVAAPVIQTWTGGYIGGHAALARGSFRDGFACPGDEGGAYTAYALQGWFGDAINYADCDENNDWDTLDPKQGWGYIRDGETTDLRGYLAGAQIGFNYQFGNRPNGFVIGAEVSHSVSSISGGFAATLDGRFSWDSRLEITRLTTATLRAGYALGPILLYGEFGLALGESNWTNTLHFSDTDTAVGRVWGVGIEARVAHGVSLFAEFNRVRLAHDFLGSVLFDGYPLPVAIAVNSTTNVFKVGFNFHISHNN